MTPAMRNIEERKHLSTSYIVKPYYCVEVSGRETDRETHTHRDAHTEMYTTHTHIHRETHTHKRGRQRHKERVTQRE